MQRFIQNRMGGAPQPPAESSTPAPDFNSLQFANTTLDNVANELMQVARVLVVAKPDAIEVLKRMGQMGQTLQGMIQEAIKSQSGQAPGQASLAPPQPAEGGAAFGAS